MNNNFDDMKSQTHNFIGYLFGVTIFLTSCTQNNSYNTLHSPLPTPVRQVSDSITLDGNKVWKANEATTNGVNNMINILNTFDKTDDVYAYHKLHKNIEDEILTIFTKCNMKGEGHEQLHNFLLPLHAQLEHLKSTDLSVCQSTFMDMRKQLAIYPLYFE